MPLLVRWLSLLLISSWGVTGCALLPLELVTSEDEEVNQGAETTSSAPTVETTTVTGTAPSTASNSEDSGPDQHYFSEGVTRAQSAVAIGQSAQSPDDWNLAASRWQQAILYMQQVPQSDPNHSTAQQKVAEYQQNLATVKKRAAGETPIPSNTPPSPERPPGLVASIPVIEQRGGTPVVPVTLMGQSGTQQFTMLFDTGATATLITPAMADAVGVLVTGSATVTVADGRQVEIPVGYVDTLQVGDLVVQDLWVGIGGDMALLGQDVYGEYGMSIGGSRIDLYQ